MKKKTTVITVPIKYAQSRVSTCDPKYFLCKITTRTLSSLM